MALKYLIEPVIGAGQIVSSVTPLATAVAPGTIGWDSTIGQNGALVVGDGATFSPVTQARILGQSGIPMLMPSSGTFTAAGALSGLTAFDQTYANCYLFFPANAIATVSAAGFYFAQMSSTTAGTVFNNVYTSGTPTVPAVLIACTTASSYTQTTAALVNAITVTVPANSLGVNGSIRVSAMFQNNNSAGTKTYAVKWGGSNTLSTSASTNQSTNFIREWFNRGVTGTQVTAGTGVTGPGATANPTAVKSSDTTTAIDINIQVQLGTATDWTGVDYFRIELFNQ